LHQVVHPILVGEAEVAEASCFSRDRMEIHENARLTPPSRAELARRVVEGQSPKAVAGAFGVCIRTVRKWVDRFRTEGQAGPMDRASRPHRLHRPTPQAIVDEVAALRRQRCTGAPIAARLGLSPATVSRILRRPGLSQPEALEPAAPARRYQRAHPGEPIHIDIKKLGRIHGLGHRITGDRTGQSNRRGIGREFVHVRVDDASRVASVQVMPDEKRQAPSPSGRPPSRATPASASRSRG
jgi:transposase